MDKSSGGGRFTGTALCGGKDRSGCVGEGFCEIGASDFRIYLLVLCV